MPKPSQRRKAPDIDHVTTVNEDGSHYVLHPSDTRGLFTNLRRWSALILMAIYISLPWISIGGKPAVFLDLLSRRFHLFGFTLVAQDAWLLFFLITGLAFSLFYVTALFGRVWCGWACPYTIFLEHIYRRVERLVEGDGPQRRRLDNSPWNAEKITKRTIKHGLFLIISLLIAHIFLSYFVSLPRLYEMVTQAPLDNIKSFSVVIFLTAALYFCFAFFREQFCILVCPYGRIQSALTDEHSLVVGYDEKRGEPRGSLRSGVTGDCIECQRCVQVCPTGIDIRDGLQIECVGCANCIDACDEVMLKVDRPKGLIRYDSLVGLRGGRTRWLRPRTYLYTALCCLGIAAAGLGLSTLRSFQVGIVRMTGAPFYLTDTNIRNQFQVRLGNKTNQPIEFDVSAIDTPPGTTLVGVDEALSVDALGEQQFTVLVEVPRENYHGSFPFHLTVAPRSGARPLDRELKFVGPPHLPPVKNPPTEPAP